jgi:Mn2+/Fe2+ NRAMP family transporter
MKSMLIAAAIVGAAVAGLILYLRNHIEDTPTLGQGDIKDAAKSAYDTMNEGLGKLDRPAQHAMG